MARYRTNTNTWEDLGAMPAIGSFAFCAWEGGIVVVGGKKEISPAGRNNRIRTAASEYVWYYNIETTEWSQLDSLSKPRINPTAAVINGALYCCAGLSPSQTDEEMVVNNPDTERLLQRSDKWEDSGMKFQQNTHFIKYYDGHIFASHQDRNMERLFMGTMDYENDCINWIHSVKVPAGAQYVFQNQKLSVFGGIITEVAMDQIIPFEILQMSDKIYSLNLADLEDENIDITLEDETIPLCNKLTLFCANICKGPIY